VEALSPCPVYSGRLNGRESPAEMLLALRDRPPGDPVAPGALPLGELWNADAPEYTATCRQASGRRQTS
jgi:hypothetical protein